MTVGHVQVNQHPYRPNAHGAPPVPRGSAWSEVGADDELAAGRSAQLARAAAADATLEGTVGTPASDELARWHYRDELLPTGLYRFFRYVTAEGVDGVGALRFAGDAPASTVGELADVDQGDELEPLEGTVGAPRGGGGRGSAMRAGHANTLGPRGSALHWHGGGAGHGHAHGHHFHGRGWLWHGGAWWAWDGVTWIVASLTGGAWSSPIDPSPALLAFASGELAASGGNPVTERLNDGRLYLFTLEAGATVVRVCTSEGFIPSTVGQDAGQEATCDPTTDPNCGSSEPGGATTQGGGGTTTEGGGGTNVDTGGGGGTGGGGQTSGEPIPQPDGSCGSWVADASNAQIVSLATSISYHNTPVPWTDQGVYRTKSSDGTTWALVMWWQGGRKMVAAWRCVPAGAAGGGKTTTTATASSSGAGGLLAGLGGITLLGLVASAAIGHG